MSGDPTIWLVLLAVMLSEVWKMPLWLSIAIIVGILAVSVGASLWATRDGRAPKSSLPEAGAA